MKLTPEALMGTESIRNNLNELFAQSVINLGEEHHIRVVYALQTLCGLIRAVTRKQVSGSSGFDRVNLLIGFEKAEQRMQQLIEHINR